MEHQIAGRIHTTDERALVAVLRPLFSSCRVKDAILVDNDVIDMEIYAADRPSAYYLVSAAASGSYDDVCAVIRTLVNALGAAGIESSFEIDFEDETWERIASPGAT